MTTTLFEEDIEVLGLRRSGLHAIVNWIVPHFSMCYFHNDSDLSLSRSHFTIYCDGTATDKHYSFQLTQSPVFINLTESMPLSDFSAKLREYEKERSSFCLENGFTRFSADIQAILVIRDPFNHLASAMESDGSWIEPEIFTSKWIEYAREYLGQTDYVRFPDGSKCWIDYNEWFQSREYRMAASGRLGRPFTDEGLEHVATQGGGSSFDGTLFDNNAQQMDVLSRWTSYVGNPVYQQYVRDEEFLFVAEQAYPELTRRVRELL